MGTFVSPGAYFRELDLSEYAPALSTCILGIVGTATKGPINQPVFITNADQAVSVFGPPTPDSYFVYAMLQFLKRGNKVWAVRVAGGSFNGPPYTSASKAYVDIPGGEGPAVVRSTAYGPFNIISSHGAFVVGTEMGNFNISQSAGNNKLKFRIFDGNDWGPDVEVTIPDGVYNASTLGATINGLTTGINCYDDGYGRLKIETILKGSSIRLEIMDVDDSVYLTVGINTGVYVGSDGNDYLRVLVDGSPEEIYVLGGNLSAMAVADDINSKAVGFYCRALPDGRIELVHRLAGSTHTLQVSSLSTADTLFGFDNDVHAGSSLGDTCMRFIADTEGTWANGLMIGIYSGSKPDTFRVQIYTKDGIFREDFNNLSIDPSSNDYFVERFKSSKFVRAEDIITSSSMPQLGRYYMAGGNDGIADVTDADYIGISLGDGTKTGLQLFSNAEEIDINLIAVPGVSSAPVHLAMLELCEVQRGDCFAVLDPPFGLSVQQVVDFHNGEGAYAHRPSLNSSYGAIYWPWVKVYDPYNQREIWLPPSGFALAVMAYTDYVADPWWAPAGLVRGHLLNALEIEYSPTQGERDYLYGEAAHRNCVNPIVDFHGDGITIWGQKTLLRRPTSLDRINVRRMVLYARKVVATVVKYLVFDPNDPQTWRRYVNLVSPIFEAIKSKRGLYDFKVVCDETTNTPDLIDQGIMTGRILMKPTKAAEIIVNEFVLLPTGANFSEYVVG